jgi:hypothetical protein
MLGNRRGADLRIESRSEAVLAGDRDARPFKAREFGDWHPGSLRQSKLQADRDTEEASPVEVPVRALGLVHPVPSV